MSRTWARCLPGALCVFSSCWLVSISPMSPSERNCTPTTTSRTPSKSSGRPPIPAPPIFDYGVPREKLIEQAVWFTLRGMGVKQEAIERYYNPEGLMVLMG